MSAPKRMMCLTWDPQCRRIESLARVLDVPLHVIHVLKYRQPLLAPIKYCIMAVLTIRLLLAERPGVVVVTVPPLPSALVAYLYTLGMGARLVIDAQTGAFSDPLWLWSKPAFRWLCRRSLVTLVTNSELRQVLESWEAPGMVLEDPIPSLPGEKEPEDAKEGGVVVVGSYASDEPIQETLEAASQCPDLTFYVTGRLANAPQHLVKAAPGNVQFTDYLSDEDYALLLRRSELVVVLCALDDTMLCGAYEALSVAKPLVTSRWPAMQRRFSKGTVFVDNDPCAIRDGIRQAVDARARLAGEMRVLRDETMAEQEHRLDEFRRKLCSSQGLGTP